jgi:hypothetical protein
MCEVVIDGYPFRKYKYADGKYGFREPSYRDLKRHLIAEFGTCYHCGKMVHEYPHVEGEPPRHDLATIDHLTPRPHHNNPAGRKRYAKVEKVLACLECNHRRNVQFTKKPELT